MKQIRKRLVVLLQEYEKAARKAREQSTFFPKYGHLRAVNTKKGPRYYYVTRKNDTKGRYLTKSDVDQYLARQLAQRDYWKKVLRVSQKWEKAISRFLKDVPEVTLSEIYGESPARRRLIDPMLLSDDEYVSRWLAMSYSGKPFHPEDPVLYTNRGERVRSKSEKIIADKLSELGIPYRYEAPLTLKDGFGKSFTAYPDFTLLDMTHRREVYLEYFGMMDREKYRDMAVNKLASYQKAGIWIGSGLLFVLDFDGRSFDSRNLERMLKAIPGYEL